MKGFHINHSTAQYRLQYPWGIAFNHRLQQLVVTDGGDQRIQRFQFESIRNLPTPSTSTISSFQLPRIKYLSTIGSDGRGPIQFGGLAGISYQPFTHHIVACDDSHHRVHMLNEDGTQLLCSIGHVSRYSSSRDGEFHGPLGITCRVNGEIVVADSNNSRVQIFDARGVFIRKFGSIGDAPHQFGTPYDVCMLHPRWSSSSSSSSSLLVVDHNSNRISIWSGDGHQHLHNIRVYDFPCGICVDLHGFIHVSCLYSHCVQVLDPRINYSLIQTLGSKGSVAGEFNRPSGLCVDTWNRLMVVDHANSRVQFYSG